MKRSEFIKKTALGMTMLAFAKLDIKANTLVHQDDEYDYEFEGDFKYKDETLSLEIILEGELKKNDLIEISFLLSGYEFKIKYKLLKDFKENEKIDFKYYEALKMEAYNFDDDVDFESFELSRSTIFRQINKLRIKETKDKTILNIYKDKKEIIEFENYKGGGCYLTTACTINKGLPDNCYELQTLRSLRDNYLLKNKEGIKIVDEYYKLAPAIVTKIHSNKDKEFYLNFIYDNLVINTVNLIENDEYELAQEFYTQFTRNLHGFFIQQTI